MSFLASMLLLNLDPFDGFKALCNILNRKCHMAFFQMDMIKIKGYKETFKALFSEFIPALFSHMEKLSIDPDLFLFDWILTLFARSLPLEFACRIWDCYFLQGEVYLFKTALGILKTLEKRLIGQTFDVICFDLTHLPPMEEKEFFKNINSLLLTEKKYEMTVSKFLPKIK